MATKKEILGDEGAEWRPGIGWIIQFEDGHLFLGVDKDEALDFLREIQAKESGEAVPPPGIL